MTWSYLEHDLVLLLWTFDHTHVAAHGDVCLSNPARLFLSFTSGSCQSSLSSTVGPVATPDLRLVRSFNFQFSLKTLPDKLKRCRGPRWQISFMWEDSCSQLSVIHKILRETFPALWIQVCFIEMKPVISIFFCNNYSHTVIFPYFCLPHKIKPSDKNEATSSKKTLNVLWVAKLPQHRVFYTHLSSLLRSCHSEDNR